MIYNNAEMKENFSMSNNSVNKKPDFNNKPNSNDDIILKFKNYWNGLNTVGKLGTISVTFALFFGFIALVSGRLFSFVIAFIWLATATVALALKDSLKNSSAPFWIIILSFLLALPYLSLFKISLDDYDSYEWDKVILTDILPKPESSYGKISTNSHVEFELRVTKTTKKEYADYIKACQKKGFTIDTETNDSSFCGFNKQGYKLSLNYYEQEKEMNILLTAGKKLKEFVWPESGYAQMLPVPETNLGNIEEDDEKSFIVYLGNNTIDTFNDYVKACQDKGFDVVVNSTDKLFNAKNADGYRLSVEYQGNSVVCVSLLEPEFVVNIEVECDENWIFSKYDVDVYVNDSIKGTISHGDAEKFKLILTKGTYLLKFISTEDNEVDGEVEFSVQKDENLKYKISCSSSRIKIETIEGTSKPNDEENQQVTDVDTTEKPANIAEIPDDWTNLLEKHYEEVKKQFEDAGFTNVICEAYEVDYNENNVFEGSVVNIAIGENGEVCTFEKGEEWDKDVKIRIDYRVKPAKPDTTQIVLPQEDSKLGKDFDSKGLNTVYYINIDGEYNTPSLKTWGSATVTDGVAEYLNYLKSLGFTVTITDKEYREPYSGFHIYNTDIKVENADVSWTMSLYIQSELYVEYELDVYIE